MGHFNNEASQSLCTPKFPKACDISMLSRTARCLIWRECGVGGQEKSCCRTCPISLLGFAAPPELCSPAAAEHVAAVSELAEHLARHWAAFTRDRPAGLRPLCPAG